MKIVRMTTIYNRFIFILFLIIMASITLLNQRQLIGQYVAYASMYLFFLLILTSHDFFVIFSTSRISSILLFLSLVFIISFVNFIERGSSIYKYFGSTFYFLLVYMVSYYYFYKNIKDIEFVKVFILIITIFSIYKVFDISNLLVVTRGHVSQTNWGNVVGSCLPFIFLGKKRYQPIYLFLFSIIIVVGLKRTGIFALGIVYIVYFGSYQSKSKLKRIMIFCLSCFLLILIGFFLEKTFQEFYSYATKRMINLQYDGGSGRLDIYFYAVEFWIEKVPLIHKIAGYGYGGMNYATGGGIAEAAHNDSIDFLYNYGILSMLLLWCLYFRMIQLVLYNIKNRNRYSSFIISIIGVFFVYSFFSSLFHYYYFFSPLILGYAFADVEYIRRKEVVMVLERKHRRQRA